MPDTARLHEGLALHRQGHWAEAEAAYRAVLADNPQQADAWQLLGALAQQTGRAALAIESLERALAVAPPRASWLYNLANALVAAERYDEAEQMFARALALDPQLGEAALNWGSLCERRGQLERARELYEQSLAIDPGSAAACSNLGALAQRRDDTTAALDWYRRALALDPDCAPALANLGSLLRGAGQWSEAERALARALELDPGHYAARHNLGELYQETDRLEAAETCYRQALGLRPDSYETRINLGAVLRERGAHAAAEVVYAQAVALAPQRPQAWINRGLCAQDQGKWELAEGHFTEALRLTPDDGEAHLNRALLWLQTGNLAAGWREYEWRWQAGEARGHQRRLLRPAWRGEPLAGRRVQVVGEQGIGDEVMFASCLADLIEEGAAVEVTCDRRLASLFARSFPRATVLPVERGREDWEQLARRAVDWQVSAGDLPRYLRADGASFPRRAQFLTAERRRVAAWRARLDALGPGLKVGLAWRGGKKPLEIRRRSLPLGEWGALAAIPGLHWINLQYGPARHEVGAWPAAAHAPLVTFAEADPLGDLDDLAALIAALDLVISVPNAGVHLAGGLGVPGWLLLPRHWGWRWFVDREDSPWYPSLRIWRQPREGDWPALVEGCAAELARLVSDFRTGLG